MPTFFVRWHVDNSKLELPTSPADIGKLFSSMLKMAKVDLHFRSFSDFAQFGNGMEGYALSELEDKVALAAVMFKYRPIITWEIYPVLNVEESKTVIKEAAEAVKGY
jgi:Domain of unknown function (DUF3303)